MFGRSGLERDACAGVAGEGELGRCSLGWSGRYSLECCCWEAGVIIESGVTNWTSKM